MMICLIGRRGRALIKTATRRGQTGLTTAPISASLQFKLQARSLSMTPSCQTDKGNEFRHSEDLAKERYELRANEDIDRKRARLLYQSKKRGMLENGVILASFADKYLDSFDANELDEYDRLINLPSNDWDIFYWATKTKPTPPEFETAVMQKLRSHLNKKVSKNIADASVVPQKEAGDSDDNEGENGIDSRPRSKSILDGNRPDEIVFQPTKNYKLDIDPNEVDLVNYPKELFDEGTRSLGKGRSIVNMTEWRKKFFERRLRRVISSPVSVRNLSDDKDTSVWTQKVQDKRIASEELRRSNLIDSLVERSLKHHNFVQFLMSHEFTDQLDEYEMEAEAWTNTLWLRNYGKSDVTIRPSKIKCTKCRVDLHCCDPGLDGYVPKELFAKFTIDTDKKQTQDELPKCQRCNFLESYQTNLGAHLNESKYKEMLTKFKGLKQSVICLIVDLTDLPCGVPDGLINSIGTNHRVVIVGNKLDLLPTDDRNIVEKVTKCLRGNLAKIHRGNKNLHIHDVVVLSARTGFGVETLVSKLIEHTEIPRDIYLLGCANSGKSTLFNALLQSDLSAVRDVDLLSRVSREEDTQGTGISMLKFPISRPEGWEIELKKRRAERVLRNATVLDRSLESTTRCRQVTMPHMPMLIDCLNYPSITKPERADSSRALVDSSSIEQQQFSTDVKFSDDHPFQRIKPVVPLSATKENFPNHPFFYQTPALLNSKDQLHDLLTNDERLEVFPNETIVPRHYSIRPLQSIFIAGLARLDLITATSYITVTIFASKYLPIHVISTRKADQFYDTFLGSPYLGVPFGDSERLRAWPRLVNNGDGGDFHIRKATDVVLSSAGWALIEQSVDQECIVRGWTPQGRGICHRWPPLVAYVRKSREGKKLRDTPLFVHPHFSIDQVTLRADRRQ